MTKEQYSKIVPYKSICAMFEKHGEYVGGADALVPIYEYEFATQVNSRCPGCFGAMLLDCYNKIQEYERSL